MSLEPDRVERLRKKLMRRPSGSRTSGSTRCTTKCAGPRPWHQAYRQAKANAGAAGVDGVRFEDIEAYGEDRWLAELRQELVEETYHPQPVRRVMIPKPGGGERPLGSRRFGTGWRRPPSCFSLSRSSRPTSRITSMPIVRSAVRTTHWPRFRKRLYGGQEHVVDADVTQYFDTIPHAELLQSVARRVADGKILRLLKLWLKSPVEERDERGNRRMTGGKKSKRGTPQGGVVSPLLANIYINRLLRHWRKTGRPNGWGRSSPMPMTSSSSARVAPSRREPGAGIALAGEARSDDPSHQDAPLSRPRRAVRLPGLHLWSGTALADREAILVGPALEESPEEAQGEDQRPAVPGKSYALAGAA